MKLRTCALLLAAVLLMAPAEAAQRTGAAPNNVRAEIVRIVGDSITWRNRWTTAPPGRFEYPITDYEVHVIAESSTGAGRIAGTDTVDAGTREAMVTVYHDCEDPRNIYHTRVRALSEGGPGPWGVSAETVITCTPTLPGAPTVQADTVSADTVDGGGIEEPEPEIEHDSIAVIALYLAEGQPHPPGTWVWSDQGLPSILPRDSTTGELQPINPYRLCAVMYLAGEPVAVANHPVCADADVGASGPLPVTDLAAEDWPDVTILAAGG